MSGRRRDITPEDEATILQAASELRAKGHSWRITSKRLDIGEQWLKRRLIPGFADKSNLKSHEKLYRNGESHRVAGRWRRELESHQQAQPRPADTRNFTQQFMGDPLPGRSALDRKLNGPELCRDCANYVHVPFTCGSCGRRGRRSKNPSIVDERTDHCGIKVPRFFRQKAEVA